MAKISDYWRWCYGMLLSLFLALDNNHDTQIIGGTHLENEFHRRFKLKR